MLKKNTRKRLLAGALATVMMLTMCPSWALADDEDIAAPLPLVDENRPVAESAPVETDTTKTPADSTPSVPEAKPAEDQNTAPAPSNDGANGGTDSTESGNSTNSTIPEGSGNISQKNDVVSNSPENEISMASLDVDLALYWPRTAMYFVLLPKLGPPTSNANQGQINYLPSSYDTDTHTKGSDGGVLGLSAYTGYRGSLTKKGMQALAEAGGSITNIEEGLNTTDYLNVPDDLGFFTPGNWNDDGTYRKDKPTNTDETTRKSLLDTTNFEFNPNKVTIVWYTIKDQSDGIHVDGYLKGVPVNVTYYPNYTTNGISGKNEDPIVDEKRSGDTYTIRGNIFEIPDGYSFGGWYTEAACTNKFTDTTTVLMTDLPLYAKWVPNEYTVTWESEGNTLGAETVAYGKMPKKTFPAKKESTPEFDYKFVGWKVKNGGDALVDPNTTAVTENVTYVAVFTPVAREYTVTYKVDDKIYTINNVEQVFTHHYGDNVILAAKPTRDGFNFNGWLPEGVALNATGTDFQMPANNVVIRGTFDANSFYVAYYVDGILYASELHKTGENVTIRDDLAKDGFTFSGWTRDNVKAENFDMPAHNVEIHGSYRQNTHKYTINKHFYNEKDAEVKVDNGTPQPAVENTAVSELYKADAKNQTDKDGKNYVYVSGLTKVTPNLEGGTLTKDVIIDLYYYLDVKGGEKPDENGNGIPDAWEYRLTFKVLNGAWNDDWHGGGNADFVTYVQCKDQNTGKPFKAEAVVVPATCIPEVGEKPNSGYHAGSWNTTFDGKTLVKQDTVFTYTYAKNSSGGSSGGSGGHHRKPTVTIPDKVPTGLNGNDHYAYIVGYPDKTVRPQNGITRAEVATIFFRLLTDETRNANSTKSNSYSDVAAGAWYNHAVSTLSAMGIVKGDSNGKFNPNAPITRAEFAAIAARFDDKANSTTADFSDIVSHWAKNEISAASNNGWINGYPDGTFRPDNKITRAEAMTLVNRVLKRLPETAEDLHDDMIKWSDNSDASQWFYLAVQEATNSHYYKAKENKFEKWSELRDTRDWTELEK